jgi:tricorn protease
MAKSLLRAVVILGVSVAVGVGAPAQGVVGQAAAGATPLAPGFVQFPALSPDGSMLVFSSQGDLWIMPVGQVGDGRAISGVATRLTSHPAEERRAIFSPDGSALAFESDRDGARNLYVMPLLRTMGSAVVSGAVTRLTTSDRPQAMSGWSSASAGPWAGEALLYAETNPGIHRAARMFRVPLKSTGVGLWETAGPATLLTGAFGNQARLSPDGSQMLFIRRRPEYTRPRYGGTATSDIWAMQAAADSNAAPSFRQLTTDPRSDADAFVAADGSIVFLSTRTGQGNIWRMDRDGGNQRALTNFAPGVDGAGALTIGHGVRDFSVNASGTMATFVVWDTLYVMPLAGNSVTPVPVRVSLAADVLDSDVTRLNLSREVTEAVLSPDGKTIAQIARGEVYVRSTEENWPTRRVTNTVGRERDLAWSPDGRVLWFISDEADIAPAGQPASRVMYATVVMSREDIEEKKPAPAATPAASSPTAGGAAPGGGAGGGEPKAEPAAEPAATATAGAGGASEPKVEPGAEPKADEPKSGATAGAAGAGGAGTRSRERRPDFAKRWAEALTFETKALEVAIASGPNSGRNDGVLGMELSSLVPSPDGRTLLVTRGLGDLVAIDLVSKTSRDLTTGWNIGDVQWASDSRHVLFSREDLDFNSDVFLLDSGAGAGGANPGTPLNISRHPDTDDQPRLSADGKVMVFRSERAGENGEFGLYAITLDRSLDSLRPYELEEYFKKQATAARARKPIDPVLWDDAKWVEGDADRQEKARKAAGRNPTASPSPFKPLTFKDLDSAYLRVRRVNVGSGSIGTVLMTPGGDRIVFSQISEGGAAAPATPPTAGGAAAGSEPALVSVSYKGDDRKSIASGSLRSVALSLSGERVSYVRSGQASAAPVAGGKVDLLAIDAPVVLEARAQQRLKFAEAVRVIGNGFYHPTLKDLDWRGLSVRYLELASMTRTTGEFDRVVSMLLGELDASHMGITGPDGFTPPSLGMGYLGIETTSGPEGLTVASVLADGPADDHPKGPRVGDVIVAIDEEPTAAKDLGSFMVAKSGRETLLRIRRAAASANANASAAGSAEAAGDAPAGNDGKPETKSDAKLETIIITPTSFGEESELRYKAEVAARRAAVEALSDGRLGYLHIRGMNLPSVRDFERDLYAAAHGKDGLVIDVRDNGGGFTADILLASLAAPVHAKTQPRGVLPSEVPFDAYPRDRRLIYSWARPIVVLINENSFSNAEIFAHAIKVIKRGKLVGTATYGGVISTGAARLIDGSTLRTPFRGWYLPDGRDLENNGAEPDVNVPALPGDEAAGRDAQLEAAVRELLGK